MWKLITVNDLRKYMAEPEIVKLSTLVKDNEQQTILLDTIQLVSEAWRGALSTKHVVDSSAYYIPTEYEIFILAHIRYEVWTRIPNSGSIGLDERRLKAYDKAMELFDNPTIRTSDPDPENSPEGYDDPSIIVAPYRIYPSYTGVFDTTTNS
jgi:hypothetical protein